MKKTINYPIIAEGLSDKNKILSLFEAVIFITNGNDFDKGLMELFKTHKIKPILMLDPDSAGISIHNKIKAILNNYIEINYINPSFSHKKKKGVAELEDCYLTELLLPYCGECISHHIGKKDFFNLGICGHSNSKQIREKVCNALNINNKSSNELLDIINTINMSIEDLKQLCA